MTVVSVEDEGLTVSAMAELARKGTIILTRGGKPLVAVKDLSGSDWESISLANNPEFQAIIDRYEEGGVVKFRTRYYRFIYD